ncbi:uncharacterized protein LOC108737198 isoform X2 [Agrilus planipennis]|uniref:Uncharacterized protein LOC108737198 isoform X2 n=1 Tax=Agrilus planipennis TaxID=224129 RepID=A0A1W4WZC9_AGRPL|nr:uncharacterized protein LOC108737198 isoform X2 [Agrilus planipennis]
MDSGLGSDDERRHRTKEQKQQQNQQRQLFSSCFIDASTLGDESDQDIPPNDERSQGSLIFQNSIKQYSMLQMDHPRALFCGNASSSVETHVENEPATPFNSIVQVESDTTEISHRTPVGFFVDLTTIEEPPSSIKETKEKQKNLFSLVIDFKEPKREMPSKLSDSLYNRHRAKKKTTKQEKEISSSKSSLISKDSNSSRKSSTSSLPVNISQNYLPQSSCFNQVHIQKNNGADTASLTSLTDKYKATCSHDNNCSLGLANNSSSSSSGDNSKNNSNTSADNVNTSDDTSSSNGSDSYETNTKETNLDDKEDSPPLSNTSNIIKECDVKCAKSSGTVEECRLPVNEKKLFIDVKKQKNEQFVKLSDLQKQFPRLDLTVGPCMVHSIPESSWVESPLSLSRSATYRSAPPRPPEPEPYELSDSGSFSDISISQTTGRSVQRLGTDLLRMFLEEIGPDVTIEVGTYRLRAHKCILSSRCQYFAAVLGGNCLETTGNVIPLHGYSYDSVHFAMCHIYSGAAHVPESINLAELAALADMLGLEGLKEVAAHALKLRYCHSFHKPCSGCSTGVLEILPLTAAYTLEDLYHKCLRWITQNFVRIWPTRAFVALSKELQEKCYKQHVVHMHPDTVLGTILKCEELLGNIPGARWAEPVNRLVKQLAMSCQLYLTQHFCEVLSSSAIPDLNNQHNVNMSTLEEKMVEAVRTLGPDHACHSYERCSKLLETQSWNMKTQELLQKVQTNLEHCLSRQMSRVGQCHAWSKMNPALKHSQESLIGRKSPSNVHKPLCTPSNEHSNETHTK